MYDDSLKHVRTIKVGYKGAGGIAVTDRYMYVTSSDENLVYRMDTPDGSNKQVFVRSSAGLSFPWFIVAKVFASSNADLDNPFFIAANESRVAVSCRNDTVVVLDTDSTLQFVYRQNGSRPGRLFEPRGVAFDPYGWILVSDYWNNRISVLSPQGRHIQDIRLDQGGLKRPSGLAMSGSGQVVVICGSPLAIAVYGCM